MLKFADLVDQHAEALAQLSRISQGAPATLGKWETKHCAEVCFCEALFVSISTIVILFFCSEIYMYLEARQTCANQNTPFPSPSATTPTLSTNSAVSPGRKKTAS